MSRDGSDSGLRLSGPCPDERVEGWYRVWERAYTEHHPLVATYALMRGSLRALRVDCRVWRWR